MIGDRGNKKWTSLMLPEHVERLQDFFKEEEKQIDKPILSEDQLEEIQRVLNEALEYELKVILKYYQNKQIHHVIGKIYMSNNGKMKMIMNDGIIYFTLDDIVNVELE
ncbi:YolD-like family protein [Gracilibacillus saliphilus]|uniref:YolD-like family protein n=1 Tax=Gracilibacillus saliphilus TaxID=543890 RepID=UPI0013D35A49|nr:YolD-like family protein [Gracilibacillus saliphilus]